MIQSPENTADGQTTAYLCVQMKNQPTRLLIAAESDALSRPSVQKKKRQEEDLTEGRVPEELQTAGEKKLS